jgi:hypothetical protein
LWSYPFPHLAGFASLPFAPASCQTRRLYIDLLFPLFTDFSFFSPIVLLLDPTRVSERFYTSIALPLFAPRYAFSSTSHHRLAIPQGMVDERPCCSHIRDNGAQEICAVFSMH